MGAGKHDPTAWDSGEGTIRSSGDMVFSSLHHHSTFSYLDGFGTPEDHVRRAAELGMQAMALTEHGNVTSHVRLEQAGDKYGVKPIFGCELYTGGVGDAATQRKNHMTVLAETDQGYRNLLEVVSRGWAEGYYYEPTVSGEMLGDHKDGLIVLSGCASSLVSTSLIGGKNIDPADASYDRAKRTAAKMKHTLGDAFYLEVQAFPTLEKTRNINQGLARMSEELGIPLVATLDAHYMTPDEAHMQAILHNVRAGNRKTMEEQAQQWGYDVDLCPLDDRTVWRRLVATGLSKRQAEQAVRMSNEVASRCNVRLPKVTNLKYPLPEGENDPVALFRKWINDGWKYRRFNALPPQERQRYVDQTKFEMELIEEKGFVDYFLVQSDQVRWAKDQGIPIGPARGSAAASLVCYLMRITEVNPMLFPNLLFARFIDANRHDLPDIDLDFDDERRWEVQQYLSDKYGAERVGNIGTFTRYKGKNSLDDVQRSLYPDNWQCKADVETLKGLLIERSSGDLRAGATIEDTAEMFPAAAEVLERWPELRKSTLLEGNVRGMSVHAAGLVVANGNLTDFCAVYTKVDRATGKVKIDPDTGEPAEVVSLDKYDAEYLNVMKLDNLGLKTMGMIRICLEHIGMSLDELYAIELNDEATIDAFRRGDVVGTFQFDGRAMRNVTDGVKPDNFDEICDINALARPGPLHSGATAEYIDIKHGRTEAVSYHPIIDSITERTQGQIVYQEQILRVVRELGDFSWEEAARIRKIISKKRGEQEFNSMRAKFKKGAAKHGMKGSDADKVFSMLATAGAYAFNAAHCVSYGLLAYWTMWLKVHHAPAFYVACLRKYGDKRDSLLRDMHKHGIVEGNLRMNQAEESWALDGDTIRPGWTQIKGIAEKTSTAILEYRAEVGRFNDWDDLLAVKGVGPKTLETLEEFWRNDDPFDIHKLANRLTALRSQLRSGIEYQDEFWRVAKLPRTTHTSEQVPYDRDPEGGDTEVVWVGAIRDRNLKDLFELHHSKTGEHLDPLTVKNPELNEWVVMLGEDDTDVLTITIDRWRYSKFKDEIWQMDLDNELLLVRGLKKGFQSRRALYVTDLWVLDMEEE